MKSGQEDVAAERMTFSQTLDTLKQDGSNILVVGTDAADAHDAVCHRLLGTDGTDLRYRLFVTTDDNRGSLEEGEAGDRTQTLDYATRSRSRSDAAAPGKRSPLSALGMEIIEAVDELDDRANGLESAALRVCVDSLVTLLQNHSSESVFRLLHITKSRVDQVSGMGHFHLPVDRDHDAVNLFEPLFDAIVEVRTRGETCEQRWEFREQEIATDWLALHDHGEPTD